MIRLASEKLAEQEQSEMDKELAKIPIPPAPKNINDPVEMEKYNLAMDRYMEQTTPIRAKYAERWRKS